MPQASEEMTELDQAMEELRETRRRMEAGTEDFVRRARAIALGEGLDAEVERARRNPDVAWRFAPDRLGRMEITNLIRRNNDVLERLAGMIESQARATESQARALRGQTDALRDQMAELRHFGEKLDERTSALMDAFAMLARDLRGQPGDEPAD